MNKHSGSSTFLINEKKDLLLKISANRTKFKRIAIASLIIDVIGFYICNIIKYEYMIHELSPSLDLSTLILKLFFQFAIILALIIFIIKEYRKVLLFSMLIYIILGSVYAFMIILENLLPEDDDGEIKPFIYIFEYFEYKIYIVVLVFNILSWLCKVSSSISIGLFYCFNENYENEFESNNQQVNVVYQSNRKLNPDTSYSYSYTKVPKNQHKDSDLGKDSIGDEYNYDDILDLSHDNANVQNDVVNLQTNNSLGNTNNVTIKPISKIDYNTDIHL